ncbi:hypothetical protein MMC12_004208 [Toensbergia leucococca]|nr:hypothetical protein [Toensbergia leucococca]
MPSRRDSKMHARPTSTLQKLSNFFSFRVPESTPTGNAHNITYQDIDKVRRTDTVPHSDSKKQNPARTYKTQSTDWTRPVEPLQRPQASRQKPKRGISGKIATVIGEFQDAYKEVVEDYHHDAAVEYRRQSQQHKSIYKDLKSQRLQPNPPIHTRPKSKTKAPIANPAASHQATNGYAIRSPSPRLVTKSLNAGPAHSIRVTPSPPNNPHRSQHASPQIISPQNDRQTKWSDFLQETSPPLPTLPTCSLCGAPMSPLTPSENILYESCTAHTFSHHRAKPNSLTSFYPDDFPTALPDSAPPVPPIPPLKDSFYYRNNRPSTSIPPIDYTNIHPALRPYPPSFSPIAQNPFSSSPSSPTTPPPPSQPNHQTNHTPLHRSNATTQRPQLYPFIQPPSLPPAQTSRTRNLTSTAPAPLPPGRQVPPTPTLSRRPLLPQQPPPPHQQTEKHRRPVLPPIATGSSVGYGVPIPPIPASEESRWVGGRGSQVRRSSFYGYWNDVVSPETGGGGVVRRWDEL